MLFIVLFLLYFCNYIYYCSFCNVYKQYLLLSVYVNFYRIYNIYIYSVRNETMICVFVCDLISKTPAKITTFLRLGGPFANHMFLMHCSMSNARVPWINAFVGDPPLPLAYRRRCLCAHSLPPLSHSNNNYYS